ncbi:RnfABCDGE type electron transport complex subunit B [Solimonas sp. K1W22B-7]|uniref:RnfABCDGE type electron transport complex subunit B n=1 Tax=Solimonas sp. K1W22B-7 TaxID=2303331 RepID=UPI000E3305C0|nr:RnfABCDGE type electron transport complex subunit B [Solimonas sp. K1W22B-7]AXQ28442.1 RnfABCDGE type electron transport complex subunit B [Solimonas sp. K1W22B-7]
MPTLATRIDALLPQTQCQRCGYPACRPYADAVAEGTADINQCPPGGDEGIAALAALTGKSIKPMNPVNGAPITQAYVALIDEAVCIGCTKCIQVCPTDAILGASQLMHSVIAAECSGCELCLPACPVDCIVMAAAPDLSMPARAPQFRRRYEQRERRLARIADQRRSAHEQRKTLLKARAAASDPSEAPAPTDPVARALAAARAKAAKPQ